MMTFKSFRIVGTSLLLGAMFSGHALVGEAATPACDRACLEGVAEKYLAAMLTHDPLLAVPYGQRPGCDTGVKFPSEQAGKDGFKEY